MGLFTLVVKVVVLKDLGELEGWKRLKAIGIKITNNTSFKNELANYLQNRGDHKLWTISNATDFKLNQRSGGPK
ncbi:hypothetical protein IR120_05955 [Muribacter muris]|uniref:hypothetical protein n=1 Tax=Muribacter muris TaxID=67855 RepID=UPI001431F194|nr:hypothetical protein [Muribacter muris]MBF0785016.1 hypothetical protein [Muribacter muris]